MSSTELITETTVVPSENEQGDWRDECVRPAKDTRVQTAVCSSIF